MLAYLPTCPNPPTYLHVHNVVVNNEHFDNAGQVFQFHIPNSLPIHPCIIQILNFKYDYVSRLMLGNPYASIAFQKNINYPSALGIYIFIYPYVGIGIQQ